MSYKYGLFFTGWLSACSLAMGQTDSLSKTHLLDEVIVTGIRQEQFRETSLPVQVLSNRTIQQTIPFNLSDALTRIPGVSQLTTGFGISKPVIRGLYGNRVLVLLNGNRFDNQQWQDEHGLGLSTIGIDRVEVIKGPVSVLYGSDAMGGVVNLIDEAPALPGQHQSDFNTRFYSNTLGTLTDAGYKTATTTRHYRLRVGLENHADYSDGNGQRVLNSRTAGYYLKAGYGFQRGRWASENSYNGSFNQFGFIIDGLADFFKPDARWSRQFAGPHHIVALNILTSQNTLQLQESTLKIDGSLQSNLRMEDEGGGQISLKMHLFSALSTVRWEKALTPKTLLILTNRNSLETNTNYGGRIIIPDAITLESGASAFLKRYIGRLTLETGAGVQYKYIKTLATRSLNIAADKEARPFVNNRLSANGLIGLTWALTDQAVIKLNSGVGYRAPNLAELSSDGLHEGIFRYEIGSPSLLNEQNWNTDLGLIWEGKSLSVNASVFYNQFYNYIFLAPTNEQFYGFPVFRFRQQDARLYGGEAAFTIHPWRRIDWLNTFALTLAQLGHGKVGPESRLPFIPAPKFTTALRWSAKGSKNGWYVQPEFVLVAAQNKPAGYETATPAYQLINLYAGGTVRIHERAIGLRLAGNNLLNRAYVDHLSRLKNYGILNPGRNFLINVSIPFN